MNRWVNRLTCQTHKKIFCRCHLLLIVVNKVTTMVSHRGRCCSDDWAAAHGGRWDLGISPDSSSRALWWPSPCFTSHQRCYVSAEQMGPQEYVSFPLHGTSAESEVSLHFTSLLTAWEHVWSCRTGMLLPPVAATPVFCRLPGISVAMGMFSFELRWASVLSRHLGGLGASIGAAFPPRRERRGTCTGHSRRWVWRYKLRRLGVVLGSPAQFWEHMATPSSC